MTQLTDPSHLPIVDVLVVFVYPTELPARFENLLVDGLGVVVRRDVRQSGGSVERGSVLPRVVVSIRRGCPVLVLQATLGLPPSGQGAQGGVYAP